jgi:hypothetical protein
VALWLLMLWLWLFDALVSAVDVLMHAWIPPMRLWIVYRVCFGLCAVMAVAVAVVLAVAVAVGS